jgi:hypothetical protein
LRLKKIFLSIHHRISMSLYKSNHISLVGVWINFIPHLSSVLRNCFLLSVWITGAGGVGRGETHESVHQQQPSWIESLCEWYWSVASSISENCSAQHNTKEMAYLCLTCSYCCIFDWQYLYVGHTYAWHLILCFQNWRRREEQRYCTLSVPATAAAICKYLFCSFTCLQYKHCLTPRPCKLCIYYIHLLSHFILFSPTILFNFSLAVKQSWMGYSKKSKS